MLLRIVTSAPGCRGCDRLPICARSRAAAHRQPRGRRRRGRSGAGKHGDQRCFQFWLCSASASVRLRAGRSVRLINMTVSLSLRGIAVDAIEFLHLRRIRLVAGFPLLVVAFGVGGAGPTNGVLAAAAAVPTPSVRRNSRRPGRLGLRSCFIVRLLCVRRRSRCRLDRRSRYTVLRYCAASRPAMRPNTTVSTVELPPRRFAPCTPPVTSPAA